MVLAIQIKGILAQLIINITLYLASNKVPLLGKFCVYKNTYILTQFEKNNLI